MYMYIVHIYVYNELTEIGQKYINVKALPDSITLLPIKYILFIITCLFIYTAFCSTCNYMLLRVFVCLVSIFSVRLKRHE